MKRMVRIFPNTYVMFVTVKNLFFGYYGYVFWVKNEFLKESKVKEIVIDSSPLKYFVY